MAFDPKRRLLWVPAFLWVPLPLPLLFAAASVESWWAPPKPPLPAEVRQAVDGRIPVIGDIYTWSGGEPILVTRDGSSFRIVPRKDLGKVRPVWQVMCCAEKVGGWVRSPTGLSVGLLRSEVEWHLDLWLIPEDPGSDQDGENLLGPLGDDLRGLRPVVVQELNNGSGAERKGDRFERLFTSPPRSSSYLCPQNLLVLQSWASLLFAFVAVARMLVPLKRQAPGR